MEKSLDKILERVYTLICTNKYHLKTVIFLHYSPTYNEVRDVRNNRIRCNLKMQEIFKKMPKEWEMKDGSFSGIKIMYKSDSGLWLCGYNRKPSPYSATGETADEAVFNFLEKVLPKLRKQ